MLIGCFYFCLFFQLILKDVDSLLYVDTDILFLQPVEDIWALLSQFNSSQLAAMAPEHEEPRIGWYNRFARHPYYGKTGINSGVMLMNMTRLREKFFKVMCRFWCSCSCCYVLKVFTSSSQVNMPLYHNDHYDSVDANITTHYHEPCQCQKALSVNNFAYLL